MKAQKIRRGAAGPIFRKIAEEIHDGKGILTPDKNSVSKFTKALKSGYAIYLKAKKPMRKTQALTKGF